MLTYLFRPLYPSLKWRPKTVQDLLNRKLCRLWKATEADIKILEVLHGATGRE
jgi:hypothetical protein